MGTIVFFTASIPSAHSTSLTPILSHLLGLVIHGGSTSAFEQQPLYSRQRWKHMDPRETSTHTLSSAPASASCFPLVPAEPHSSVAANVFLIHSASVHTKGSCSRESVKVMGCEHFRQGQCGKSGCNCANFYSLKDHQINLVVLSYH